MRAGWIEVMSGLVIDNYYVVIKKEGKRVESLLVLCTDNYVVVTFRLFRTPFGWREIVWTSSR
jgi:hypothetical protein